MKHVVWLLVSGIGIQYTQNISTTSKTSNSKVFGAAMPPKNIRSNYPIKLSKSCLESEHTYYSPQKHFKWWLLSTWWVCPYRIVAEPLHKKVGPLLCRGRQFFALWSWICFINHPVMGQTIPNQEWNVPMMVPNSLGSPKNVIYWLIDWLTKNPETRIAGQFFTKILELSGTWQDIQDLQANGVDRIRQIPPHSTELFHFCINILIGLPSRMVSDSKVL